MRNSSHIEYIDIAKGLGILMVIWGHIVTQNFSQLFVYSFHMPLFFLLSGMFFRSEKYNSFKDFFLKRGKRLFIPMILYSVATWMIWAGYNSFLGNKVDIWPPLLQTIIAQGSGEFFKHNSPLWFIPCLFAVDIMYYFVAKLRRSFVIILACFCISGISMILESIYGNDYLFILPWNLDAAMMALPFYAIGNLFAYHTDWHIKIMDSVTQRFYFFITLTFVLFGLTMWLTYLFPMMSMGYSSYGDERIFHIRALLGIAFLCCLSAILTKIAWTWLKQGLLWMGKRSLDVMCTHVPIKGFIIVAIAKILHCGTMDVMSNISLSICVFCVTVVIDVIIVMGVEKIKLTFSK